MTVTEAPAHRPTTRAGGRTRASRPPFVPAVGSPYDEWPTMALPVVASASLDAATDSFLVVPTPRAGSLGAPARRPVGR